MWYLLEFNLPDSSKTLFWHNEITKNCKVMAVRDVVEKPKNNVINAMELLNAEKLNKTMFSDSPSVS